MDLNVIPVLLLQFFQFKTAYSTVNIIRTKNSLNLLRYTTIYKFVINVGTVVKHTK